MKIGVCIKPVPNSDARITIASSGNGVDASVYSKLMVNTYDECAIEAAVQLVPHRDPFLHRDDA